jgi:Ca2+-binding EF-hand superfamily protein
MEYANLPGILFDRFFALTDTNNTGYADIRSFLVALCKIYYSNIEAKIKFAFDIYDFDRDGYITKEDARIVMSYLPIH